MASLVSTTVNGNLDIIEYLRHTGDTNTQIRFESSQITIGTSGGCQMSFNADEKLYFYTGTTSTLALTLDTSQAATFAGSLKAATILDAANSAGTSNQVLTSTGSALDWKTLSEISGVDGSGTASYIPKWTDTDTIGNSIIYDSGASVGISSVAFTSPVGTLHTQAVGTNTTYLDAYSTTNGESAYIYFRKSDNDTAGTLTQTDSGDYLGALSFFGVTTGTPARGLGAAINIIQEGVSGATYVPAYISFATCTASAYGERMRITNDGNVGIGTTSPGSLLTISGNSDDGDNACALAINDEDSTGGSKLPAIMFYGGGTMQGRIRGGDGTFSIAVGSAPTTALSINTGTQAATFSGNLTVQGDTYIYNNKALNILDSGGQRSLMITNYSSGSNSPYFSADPDNQAADTKMYWYIDGAEKMSLDSGGALTVTKSSGLAPLTLVSNPANQVADIGGEIIFQATYRATSDTTPVARIKGSRENATTNNWAGKLTFHTSPGGDSPSASTEQMRITSAGKVFIGDTTASNAQLRVKQTTNSEWAVNIINQQAIAYGLSIDTSSSTSTSVYNFAAYTPAGTGFFLKNTGDVGIGTTAPSSKLHIYETTNAFLNGLTIENPNAGSSASAGMYLNCNGKTLDMRIYNALSGNFGYINSSGTLYTGLYHDGGLVLSAKSGKVGIGTTSPGTALSVYGTDYNSASVEITRTGTGQDDDGALRFNRVSAVQAGERLGGIYFNESGTARARIRGEKKDTAIGEIGFQVSTASKAITNSSADDMTLTPTGLGIGTTAPASKLHLYEETNNTNTVSHLLTIDSMSSGTTAVGFGGGIQFRGERSGGTLQGMGRIQCIADVNTSSNLSSALTFHTATSGVNSEKVRIKSDGNVGIGTTAPLYLLQVASASATWLSSIHNTSTGNGLLVRVDSGSSDAILSTHNGTSHLFIVKGTGKVGIGTYTPQRLLHIYGASDVARFQGTSTNYIDIDGNGTQFSCTTNLSFRAAVSGGAMMTIKTDGKVGIGTTTPYRNAHIYQAPDGNNLEGALQTGGTSASLGGYFGYNSTGSGRLSIISLDNSGGSNASIYLGFGLATDGSPTTKVLTLDQNKLVTFGGGLLLPNNGPIYGENTSGTNMQLLVITSSNELMFGSNAVGSAGHPIRFLSKYITFEPAGAVGVPVETMRITNGTPISVGSVGIGTTTPQYLLEVYGDATLNSSGSTTDVALRLEAAGTTKWTIKNDTAVAGGTADTLTFTSAGAANVSINQAGNVGIGTNNPAGDLEVSTASGGELVVDNNGASGVLLQQRNGGATNSGSFKLSGGTLINFFTNDAERVRIASDGKVGIGTDAPANLLNVYGGNDITPTSGGAGQFAVTGNGYTTFLAMNATASYFGHNSSARSLVLMTNETARLTISGSGATSLSGALTGTSGTFSAGIIATTISGTTISGNLFSGSGASLTTLNGSNISSGTVPAARLGSGSSITTKFLRGDNTWQTVTSGGGSVTSVAVTVGTGLDVSGSPITSSGTIDIDLDLSDFTDMTADITTSDEVILLDSGAERRKAFGELKLSKFNNDSGWTSNTGDITAVTAGTALSGGGTSGSVTLNVANPFILGDDTDTYGIIGMAKVGHIGWGDYAGFAHRDVGTTTSYALIQNSAGSTFLNAANNKLITFRINNANVIAMDATSLYSVSNGVENLGKTGNRWGIVYSEDGNFSGDITVNGNWNGLDWEDLPNISTLGALPA